MFSAQGRAKGISHGEAQSQHSKPPRGGGGANKARLTPTPLHKAWQKQQEGCGSGPQGLARGPVWPQEPSARGSPPVPPRVTPAGCFFGISSPHPYAAPTQQRNVCSPCCKHIPILILFLRGQVIAGKGSPHVGQGMQPLHPRAGCSARAGRTSISPAPQHIPGEGEQGLRAPELKCSPVGGVEGVGESPDGTHQGN